MTFSPSAWSIVRALPVVAALLLMPGYGNGDAAAHDRAHGAATGFDDTLDSEHLDEHLGDLFGGPFSLIDHRGERRSDTDFRGRFLLIYFGHSMCPDMCPADLSEMSAALDVLGSRGAQIQPLFITVDPARDRPAVLRDYVQHFHPTLIGLTGSEAEIAATAKAWRIHRFKLPAHGAHGADGAEHAQTGDTDYLVSHSPNLYLMGPSGAFLTLIPHGTDADRIAQILASYLPTPAGQGS